MIVHRCTRCGTIRRNKVALDDPSQPDNFEALLNAARQKIMTNDTSDDQLVDFDQLIRGFGEIGVRQGDVLFFHSSLRSFGRVAGGADTVIDAAVAAVSPGGTVAVPTFVQRVDGQNASYSRRKAVWDIEKSPSHVGQITQVLRKRPEAVRSDDCCNSIAAIGAEAEGVMGRHHLAGPRLSPWGPTSFGRGSPWDWLVERDAVYLLMGARFAASSIFHYAQVLWMDRKYGDELAGRTWPKFDFEKMGELVTAAGLVTETAVGKSRWRAFRAAPCVSAVLDILEDDPSLIEEMRFRLWRE